MAEEPPSTTAAYLDSLARFSTTTNQIGSEQYVMDSSAHVATTTLAAALALDGSSALPGVPPDFGSQVITQTVAAAAVATPDAAANVQVSTTTAQLVEMLPPVDVVAPSAADLSNKVVMTEPSLTPLAKQLTSVNEGLANGLQGLFGQIRGAGQAVSSGANHFVSNVAATEGKVVANAAANLQSAGEVSLTDLGTAMTNALENLGIFTLSFLNLVVEAFSGKTLPDVVTAAKATAEDMVIGAIAAVARTMAEIGEQSVADAAKSFAALVILLAKVMFKLLNGVIQLATGKEVAEWGSVAAGALAAEAGKLGAAAGDFAADLSQKSLAQLISLMSSFVDHVGNTMLASTATAWDAVHGTTTVLQTVVS